LDVIKVMIVEDEQYLRKGLILSTPWERYGCRVVGEAGNAIEGLGLARKLKPDIVITDIKMPRMSGLEMIEQLQPQLECEFILISGYNDFAYAKQALKYGVKGYLVKPIDDDELDEVLRGTVEVVEQNRYYRLVMEELEQRDDGRPSFFVPPDIPAFDSKEKYISKAVRVIQDNCARDITAKDVADALFISESYLSKLLRKNTGYTFLKLLTEIRIRKAIELMQDETAKIYEIAYQTGYRDPRYFSAIFKKVVGVTPSEYRGGERAQGQVK